MKAIANPSSVVCTVSPEDAPAARGSHGTSAGRQLRLKLYTSERWQNRICPGKFAYFHELAFRRLSPD
jgi:hypothetical protein